MTYTLKVAYVTRGGDEHWSGDIKFSVPAIPDLSPPVVTSPTNGGRITMGDLTIRWNGVPDAAYYTADLRELASSTVISIQSVTGTNCIVPSALLTRGLYYQLRVAAVNRDNKAFWTDYIVFYIP